MFADYCQAVSDTGIFNNLYDTIPLTQDELARMAALTAQEDEYRENRNHPYES